MNSNPIYPPEPCMCGAEDCEACFPFAFSDQEDPEDGPEWWEDEK